MELNDFHVGDIAYQLSTDNHENEITEVKVVKVGRKYITTKIGNYSWERKFRLFTGKYGIEFLMENIDWGYKKLLFKHREEIAEFLEAKSLKKWIVGFMGETPFPDLTLDQMRKIKEIIEGDEST